MPERPLRELDPFLNEHQIRFTCPACCDDQGRGHMVGVPYGPSGIPYEVGGPVWEHVSGSTIDDITLSPSINCDTPTSGCTFHGWVRNGIVSW